MESLGVPIDWYRTSLFSKRDALFFEQGGEESVELAVRMLQLEGYERVLDLATASGGRTIELCRRGFDVVGAEADTYLLEMASGEAELNGLEPSFVEEDPRYITFDSEFDVVLSLGGGALEHFDYDEENERAFRAAARALRPGGRLLMQLPNLIFIEAHLPARTWIEDDKTVELVEQWWTEPSKRLEGTRRTLIGGEAMESCAEHTPFQRRLYGIEELADVFNSVGLRLGDVFDESGKPCVPTDEQRQLFVEARV